MKANIPEAPATNDYSSGKPAPPPTANADSADDIQMVFVMCVSVHV
jgi:hypothetical protein